MLVVEWFMCVYTRTLPWASALRVLDMFFCEGTLAVLNFYGIGFFNDKPPAMSRPPLLKSGWHGGGKMYLGKYSLLNVRVQMCRASMWLEFVFGRLGVMTTQTSWLAQVGRGGLIGQIDDVSTRIDR